MKLNFFALLLFFAAFTFAGCSKDENNEPTYEYTYKLTGTSIARLSVQYTPTMTDPNMTEVPDDLEYEEQVTPPWEKTVQLHKNVAGAGFSASISNGIPGANYTISILDKDRNVLETTTFMVDGDGNGNALLNYYRIKP